MELWNNNSTLKIGSIMKNKKDAVTSALVLQERIEKKIFLIRGKKVMLDREI